MMNCIKNCPQGYPPGKPDIGTAIHDQTTAFTGVDVRLVIFVIVFLLIVGSLLWALYATRHMGEGEDY